MNRIHRKTSASEAVGDSERRSNHASHRGVRIWLQPRKQIGCDLVEDITSTLRRGETCGEPSTWRINFDTAHLLPDDRRNALLPIIAECIEEGYLRGLVKNDMGIIHWHISVHRSFSRLS